jgi:hypothetical protein
LVARTGLVHGVLSLIGSAVVAGALRARRPVQIGWGSVADGLRRTIEWIEANTGRFHSAGYVI